MINVAHGTKMMVSRDKLALIQDDVGWNPRWLIFHERNRSREEHEEHEGKHEGKHERITQTNKNDHTCARSSKHKERYTIQSQQRTIQRVTGSFS